MIQQSSPADIRIQLFSLYSHVATGAGGDDGEYEVRIAGESVGAVVAPVTLWVVMLLSCCI